MVITVPGFASSGSRQMPPWIPHESRFVLQRFLYMGSGQTQINRMCNQVLPTEHLRRLENYQGKHANIKIWWRFLLRAEHSSKLVFHRWRVFFSYRHSISWQIAYNDDSNYKKSVSIHESHKIWIYLIGQRSQNTQDLHSDEKNPQQALIQNRNSVAEKWTIIRSLEQLKEQLNYN